MNGSEISTTDINGVPIQVGSRVRVLEPFWPLAPNGTVDTAPDYIAGLGNDWHGHVQKMVLPTRINLYVWVVFDVPQVDSDGDGPYFGATVGVRGIEVIS